MMVVCRTGMFFLFLSFFFSFRGTAQRPADTLEKLDTTVGDTIVVSGRANESPGPAIDTANLVDTGQESTTGDQYIVSLRSVPDSVVDGYKKKPRFAYANDSAYWHRRRKEPNKFADGLGNFLTSAGFRYFIYTALAGLLIFVIIRVMTENNFGAFYRKRGKKHSGMDAENEASVEEDIDERLQQALGTGDHRKAVRYLYLRSLRGLEQRKLIKKTLEATNQEYLRQLSGTAQERPFRYLTTAYEKVWYGKFPLSEEPFQRLYRYFEDFDKTVKR